jgi:hypothetical protein
MKRLFARRYIPKQPEEDKNLGGIKHLSCRRFADPAGLGAPASGPADPCFLFF